MSWQAWTVGNDLRQHIYSDRKGAPPAVTLIHVRVEEHTGMDERSLRCCMCCRPLCRQVFRETAQA